MEPAHIFLFGLFVLSASYVKASEKKVVCYYGSWATYRNGLGKFDVENINTDLCTHLIYTFVGINSQGTVISLDSWLDLPDSWGKNNFAKFNALKTKNPNLKTILAVGGWNEGSAKYSIMAANPTLRNNFVASALKMVLNHGFDGFDVDWEYPNRRDTVNGRADVDNFTQLLKELREEFDKHGLLISAAVSATKDSAALSYNIADISKYLDIIGLMAYDMYGAWDPVTGHNAPLHKGEGDGNAERNSLFTVDVAVEYWLQQGCPPEKLVIGLPLYGRTFTLTDPNVNSVRAPSSGPGIGGPYTVTSGSIGYNEFCEKLQTESWNIRYDDLAEVPYAVQGRNWVSYDDGASLAKKVEFALQNKLAGAMVWSIETDDFHGLCHGEDFPLLRAINKALGRDMKGSELTSTTEGTSSSTTTSTTSSSTASVTSTTSVPTTTVSPTSTSIVSTTTTASTPVAPDSAVCKEEGFAANPEDCSSFFMCVRDVTGELVPKAFICPGNLHWDDYYQSCNFPGVANCSF